MKKKQSVDVPVSSVHEAEPDTTSVTDIQNQFASLRDKATQQTLQSYFQTVLDSITDTTASIQIGGNEVHWTDNSKEALQKLCAHEPVEPELPYFTPAEILSSRHYDRSDSLEFTLTVDKLSECLKFEK